MPTSHMRGTAATPPPEIRVSGPLDPVAADAVSGLIDIGRAYADLHRRLSALCDHHDGTNIMRSGWIPVAEVRHLLEQDTTP